VFGRRKISDIILSLTNKELTDLGALPLPNPNQSLGSKTNHSLDLIVNRNEFMISNLDTKKKQKLEKYIGTDLDLITELLNDSSEMDRFSEVSHYDLSQMMTSPTAEEHSPSAVESPVAATSPGLGLDLNELDTTWLNEIDDEDLLAFGKKEKGSGQSEILCLTDEALGFGIGSELGQTVSTTLFELPGLVSVHPSTISPTQLHYVVAPLKVQREEFKVVTPTPSTVVTASSSHKRKESHFPRALPAFSVEEEDVKPTLSDTPMAPVSTRGRKRASSTTSNHSLASASKKVKKYEQDPTVDPTVKNAKAAKANRERKKQELNQMKQEASLKDRIIQDLQERLEREKKEKEQYKRERDAARENSIMVQGLRGVATNIREFIQCVIPPMNSSFGAMDVHIPEWFGGVSLESGAITGIDPAVQARFDLPPDQEPSRFFTAHVNLQDNVMKFEYNPHAGI